MSLEAQTKSPTPITGVKYTAALVRDPLEGVGLMHFMIKPPSLDDETSKAITEAIGGRVIGEADNPRGWANISVDHTTSDDRGALWNQFTSTMQRMGHEVEQLTGLPPDPSWADFMTSLVKEMMEKP